MSEVRLIDANALKKAIMYKDNVNGETWEQLYDSVLAEIDNAPTVYPICSYDCKYATDYKRTKGEWLHKEFDPFLKEYGQCSNCLQRERVGNFCRNCGADMRGKEE